MAEEKNKDLFTSREECPECGNPDGPDGVFFEDGPDNIGPKDMPIFQAVKKEFDPEINVAVARANSFSVTTYEENQAATIFIGEIKGILKKAEARRVKMKAPALETCREIDAFFGEMMAPMEAQVGIVTGKQKAWWRADQEKKAEESRKAAAAAAEEERKVKAALEEKAKKAAEKGKEELAESLRQKAAETYIPPAPVAETERITRADGYSSGFTSTIKVEIHGPEEAAIRQIAAAVASGEYPFYFFKLDMVKVKRYFTDRKTKPGPQPGFMIYPDTKVTNRGGGR
jgi:hypothetical protein